MTPPNQDSGDDWQVVPVAQATPLMLALNPRLTVQLTEEQTKRIRELEGEQP